MRGAVAFLAGLLLSAPAHAYLKAGPAGYGHWLKQTTPQDGMTTSLAAAYSFRKVRDAYAGSAVKLRRTTGGTLDVGFTAAGDFDTAVAATFCLATTCYLDTVYDQSGGNRHLVQAAVADQPLYVADCTGGHPCMRLDATDWMQSSVSASATTGIMTISGVAKRTAGTGAASVLSPTGGSNLAFYPSVGFMAVYPGPGLTATAQENVWHSAIGVVNGASSNLNVDGNNFPGTQATTPTSGLPVMGSAAGTTFDWAEAFAWNNYVLTASEQVALLQNQRDYWLPLPLDTFATPAAAYSMRRLKSTYSGPAIRLRRASDNAEADINFLGFTGFTGAPIDTAAAAAHCAATTCSVRTVYDQSGNARHVTQTTAGNQPVLVFNCLGALPCMRSQAAGAALTAPEVFPLNGIASFSAVSRVDGAPSTCAHIQAGAMQLASNAGFAGQWLLFNGGVVTAPATETNWHAAAGVFNTTNSVLTVDGTTGSVTPISAVTTQGPINIAGSGTDGVKACSHAESVYWDAYALTAPERAALIANQRGFWGF